MWKLDKLGWVDLSSDGVSRPTVTAFVHRATGEVCELRDPDGPATGRQHRMLGALVGAPPPVLTKAEAAWLIGDILGDRVVDGVCFSGPLGATSRTAIPRRPRKRKLSATWKQAQEEGYRSYLDWSRERRWREAEKGLERVMAALLPKWEKTPGRTFDKREIRLHARMRSTADVTRAVEHGVEGGWLETELVSARRGRRRVYRATEAGLRWVRRESRPPAD